MSDDLVHGAAPGRTSRDHFFRVLKSIALMSTIALLLEEGCDHLVNPWAHSFFSSKAMTGSWVGQLPSNPPSFVSLTLRETSSTYAYRARCATCPDVDGALRYCDAGGTSKAYRIAGEVRSWRGSTLKLWFTAAGPDFAPGEMKATWNGVDELAIQLRNGPRNIGRDHLRTTYTVTLHHDAERDFVRACSNMR